MPEIPILAVKRVNNQVTINFRNFIQTQRYRLFRALKHNGNFSIIVNRGSQMTYIDNVPSSSKPKYKAQYLDDSGSRQKWDTSEQVWDTSSQKFADLPSGVVSITYFTL